MSKLIDLTGQRFGFWLVKKRVPNSVSGQSQWLCKCDCGIKKIVTSNSLRSGNSTSCGCNHTPDLTGKKIGMIKVLSKLESSDKSHRYWNCRCMCGNILVATTYQLREKVITSCRECMLADIKNTAFVGGKLNDVLETAMVEFERSNNLITGSIERSQIVRTSMIKKGSDGMKEQLQIIVDINKELQKNILILMELDGYNSIPND